MRGLQFQWLGAEARPHERCQGGRQCRELLRGNVRAVHLGGRGIVEERALLRWMFMLEVIPKNQLSKQEEAALYIGFSNRNTIVQVMEGGSVEVDGEGTAIITRSSVINPNRNPGWDEAQVEAALYTTLGIEKVLLGCC